MLESPVNRLPVVVIILTLLIIGIEVVFQLANQGIIGGPRGIGWRIDAIDRYGFSPRVLELVGQGQLDFDLLKRFVTYPFVNLELTQVAFCAALTLALGKFVGEAFGEIRLLAIYLITSVAGAIVFGFFARGTYPLSGGFAPVYGLIGAYSYILWLRLGSSGRNQLLAFRLIGVLLLIQLIFGVVFGIISSSPPAPTWIAELGAFCAGFGLALVVAPGSWSTFVARMRQRS